MGRAVAELVEQFLESVGIAVNITDHIEAWGLIVFFWVVSHRLDVLPNNPACELSENKGIN
jgi:hypothetical protein